MGTELGVIKVRTSRSIADESNRWNWDRFIKMKGVPWHPVPGSGDREVRSKVYIPVEQPPRVEEPRDRTVSERRVQILKEDVQRFGYSVGCEGCRAIERGTGARAHSEGCRKRG